ncbi:mannose-1-phosphate guanylyltransferase/mannose-6-phosphate isomerase [Methylonatrum kenyense]|uniref:mannose-1-phosphate guanylyltransferase/mannose-6-phosphate isomerase n=1 Tax=Methylonatrum kenyense TaxID=455253 RepID=UPI0020BF9EC1|nr:mannose-1-phosphate guanylyltransferase/mannose-6-phosphate isomerase [Methylonatrum kenyense]MCK8516768.1 mannose-1-phosphate guanylyltransferase/mannose-6-phosphate isomerase [Methylonatrum kenyense]
MNDSRIIPVVLSGGAGTRLWPLSREHFPKQLLRLASPDMTLLQQTAARCQGLTTGSDLIVVCNEAHRFLVAEQLRQLDVWTPHILLEPVGRNTAPGIAVAALHCLQGEPDAILLVMPSDHLIDDVDAFQSAVLDGLEAATEGALVTFGIRPTHPETGYGYIRARHDNATGPALPVAQFVEKPDLPAARDYLASGDYYWNSGIFLFRAESLLEELERQAPAIVDACRRALTEGRHDLDFLRLDEQAFAAAPSESIDYAVMEHTTRAMVVPMDPGWSDLGSWSALQQARTADELGNTQSGDTLLEDCRNTFVHADSRLVAGLGLDDCIIVETVDAVLVAKRDRIQQVKTVVERLRREGRSETLQHRRVTRPWGCYEGIASADRFQVKRIIVNPGQQLSLQMHHHRAEHWVVVRGTGRVTRGEESYLVSEDQSTYISLGTMHRLENPGVIPLELIEVQTGSYLGEDDILRFDDNYGRC